MNYSNSISNGNEALTVDQSNGQAIRITVKDESGEASITIPADDARKLMVIMGALVEPYPGAWNRLGRYED